MLIPHLMSLSVFITITSYQIALDRFRENFKSHKDIHFPQPLWPLVNEFVLVEDYVAGTPISQILKVRAARDCYILKCRSNCQSTSRPCTQDPSYPEAEKKRLAKSGLSAFLKMVFLDNFVHGDLHPGNIYVTENIADK